MKKEKKIRILVTGGSGFLGSHICDALTDAGHEVLIFDRAESRYIKDGQKMIIGDVLNKEEIVKAMQEIDIVYHLAALSDLDVAHDCPYETMQTNVLGTTNVLEAARQNKIKRVVFSSTIYVHSRSGSFYRVSKHACELLLEVYSERYGLKNTILRFGTLYGPRSNKANSVYRFLNWALKDKRISYKGSGQEVREYIHVRDAAKICVEVLKEEFAGQTLILTGHHRMRLYELLDMINEILGQKIKITYDAKNSESHYQQTPYSYMPSIGKKIVMNTYCDLGQSLIEILEEIDRGKDHEIIKIKEKG